MIGLVWQAHHRAGPLARDAVNRTGSPYVHRRRPPIARAFHRQCATSDPVRYARNKAVLEAAPELGLGSPTVAWLDAALRLMKRFAAPGYAGLIRQPILLVAAGRDEVVSTPAIQTFGMNLLAGRHYFGRQQARDPAGTGSLSRAVFGGLRRLRAGMPRH